MVRSLAEIAFHQWTVTFNLVAGITAQPIVRLVEVVPTLRASTVEMLVGFKVTRRRKRRRRRQFIYFFSTVEEARGEKEAN